MGGDRERVREREKEGGKGFLAVTTNTTGN